jgi:hypothetical protein
MKEFANAYKDSTDAFLAVVETLKESDLDKADHEGWTPRQVIHHVADSEAQSYARLRRLLAEPGTTIQGYDEAKWSENKVLGYTQEPINASLEVFKAVRQSSYELLTRMSQDHLNNAGVHTESGPYTVQDWIRTYTNHPLDHANQIKAQLS